MEDEVGKIEADVAVALGIEEAGEWGDGEVLVTVVGCDEVEVVGKFVLLGSAEVVEGVDAGEVRPP